MKNALLIFAKNTILGTVKTRLAATIGADQAMAVYQQLLQLTSAVTDKLPQQKIVCYAQFVEKGDVWDEQLYEKEIQQGNGLGERMENAFAAAFNQGNERVVIIGTDCPGITAALLDKSFQVLNDREVVLGPATDGGYYLLGMTKLYSGLFRNISWSTDKVLEQTIAACTELNLSYHLLPELTDIDDEQDLRMWEKTQTT